MFKAVYFHKTVRAAEVMLIQALRLSDDEFGFTTFNLNEYVELTDEFVLSSIISSQSSKLKQARKLANDYQNRKLLKCVFERILTSQKNLKKTRTDELRLEISKKSHVDENEISFNVYPNPTNKGFVNITTNVSGQIIVDVYDILGKVIISSKIDNNRLDVSNLKAGMYVIKIKQNDIITTKKLIIN